MAIGLPITASAIRDEFSYWYKSSPEEETPITFELSQYRGLVLRYPTGRTDTEGNYILNPDGTIQYSRILPSTGPLYFSDFYGSVGYFQPYPQPIITATVPARLEGWTNYTTVELSSDIQVDFRHSEVADWRPNIHRTEVTVQWQEYNSGSQQWETINSETFHDKSDFTATHTLGTRQLGTYRFRTHVQAISYAYDDDLVPYGGELGPERIVEQNTKISAELPVTYTPYQPDDPEITIKNSLWNDGRNDDGQNTGTYTYSQRTYDDVYVTRPSPTLSFPGPKAANFVFDPAYGRTPQNIELIEWEFYPRTAEDPEDNVWKPISELGTSIPGSVPDFATDTKLQWNNLGDTLMDSYQFRIKVTATQNLSDPTESIQTIVYSGIHDFYIDRIPLSPTYTLGGTTSVVNGGTFNATFRPTNMPDIRYYWRVIGSGSTPGDSSDFVSDTGDQVFDSGETGNFSIVTTLDGDTDTENFTLQMFDNAGRTGTPVATRNLRIVYGPPSFRTYISNRSPNEEQVIIVTFIAENVGDTTGRWRYVRTISDSTPANDLYNPYNGTNYAENAWYNMDLLVDENAGGDELIVSYKSYAFAFRNDSPFGGEGGNFERFRFDFECVNPVDGSNEVRDQDNVDVYDKLEYRLDWLANTSGNKTISFTETCNIDFCTITSKASGDLTWNGSTPVHVSLANYSGGTLQYRWVVKSANYSKRMTYDNGWYFVENDDGSIRKNGYAWRTVGNTSPRYIQSFTYGKIIDRGWDRLSFEDFESPAIGILGQLSNCKWSLQVRFVPNEGSDILYIAGYNNGEEVTMTITPNDVYVPTGITGSWSRSYLEGTDQNLIVKIRTSRMIGKKINVLLEQSAQSGYRLFGWPQFGPQHPEYSHPAMERENITVTSNYMEVNMGSVFTVYGLREDYQLLSAASHGEVKIYSEVRITPGQFGFLYDGEYNNKRAYHRVRDSRPEARISTSKRLGSSPALLHAPNVNNPVGQAKMDWWAHCINAMDRGLLGGHGGTFRAGIGWAIAKMPGEPSVDEKGISNEPEAWFDRTSSIDFAEEAGEVGSVRLDKGANWHEVTFDYPINTGDLFTDAYNRRRGAYRTAVPAAEMVVLNPTITADSPNGKWFPDKKFRIYALGMNAGDYTTQLGRAIPIIVRSRQPKPERWYVRVDFSRTEIDADSSAVYKARVTPIDKDGNIIPISKLKADFDLAERTLSYQLVPESAFDNPRGSVEITSSEGEDEITVHLNGSTADITEDINASIGVYKWEGKRIDYGSDSFKIKSVAEPIKTFSINPINDTVSATSSEGPRGTSTAYVVGGTPPYTYEWSHAASGGLPGTGQVRGANGNQYLIAVLNNGCSVGKITCKVTDSRGVEKKASAGYSLFRAGACPELGGPTDPLKVITLGVGRAEFVGLQDSGKSRDITGSFGVSIAGGSGKYTYKWSTSASGAGVRTGTTGNSQGLSASKNLMASAPGEYSGTVSGTITVTDTVTGEVETASGTINFFWEIIARTDEGPSGPGPGGPPGVIPQ